MKRSRMAVLYAYTALLFVVVMVALEFVFGIVYMTSVTEKIEKIRIEEFRGSFENYLSHYIRLHNSTLTGYAWWTELANAVNAGDRAYVSGTLINDKSLAAEYDIVELVRSDMFHLFASHDGKVSVFYTLPAGDPDLSVKKEFLKLTESVFRGTASSAGGIRKNKSPDEPIAWHFFTMYRGKVRLLTLSPVCDSTGHPRAGGYFLVGHNAERIFKSASSIIPVAVAFTERPPDSTGIIEKKGFRPGERFYISIRPKILIADYARKLFLVFIMLQVALGFVAFWLITPYSTRKYTTHLRDVIRSRTGALKEANVELERKGRLLNTELQMARALQEKTIGPIPETPLLDIKTLYTSMDAVGGDVIDIRRSGDGVFSFMIADVAGHGVPASLIASMTKISLLNHANPGDGPAEICRRVNEDLFSLIGETGYFMTAFFGLLDAEGMNLSYCNCGHVYPVLVRYESGELLELKSPRGKPLGFMKDPELEGASISLGPGDKIILYTDGMIEARNAEGRFYGIERLYEFIGKNRGLAPGELLGAFGDDLALFSSGKAPDDDRAMIIVEVLGPGRAQGG